MDLLWPIAEAAGPIPYSTAVPRNLGERNVAVVFDHDKDEDYTHYIEPCITETVPIGDSALEVNLAPVEGGCVLQITTALGVADEYFTQDKPWPATFSYVTNVSAGYEAMISNASGDEGTGVVEAAVYDDTNGNGYWDPGDALVGDPDLSIGGAVTVGFTAGANFVFFRVGHQPADPNFETVFDMLISQ